MALGTKRICTGCGAKFYDLEKDPIICPKCEVVYNPEVALKPKRGRKKAVAEEEAKSDEIEIDLDDVAEELDEEAADEEVDEDIDGIDIEEDEAGRGHGKDEDDVLVDLDDDAGDDIIDTDDEKGDKE